MLQTLSESPTKEGSEEELQEEDEAYVTVPSLPVHEKLS